MKVIAKKGRRCPKEGKPREYVTDSEAVEVPDTPYYRRLINDGSLLPVTGKSGKSASKQSGGNE